MGWHTCEYCSQEDFEKFENDMLMGPYSSAEVCLEFANGHKWEFPHTGLLHYIVHHHYRPEEGFVQDVLNGTLTGTSYAQSKNLPRRIGYLEGPDFPTGEVPAGFVSQLIQYIQQADANGDIAWTLGL